ncbi:transmembrane protein 248 [Centroberyx gerrardi]|uniref:transmembrane protein 248 n=1 Tax=Centroberyx gerrardi TaxID=166262 RepID=UPI003AAE6B16
MKSLVMGFWQPVTNLRDYVSQNPPGVTFFLCLLTLALSFICLSAYSHTHTLPNPDTAKDWNHLLSSLAQLQLCVKANVSSVELVSPVTSPLMEQETGGKPSVNSTKSPPPVTQLHLKVPLVVSPSSASHPLKGLSLHTSLVASQLGLAGNETVNVTLHLLSQPKGNNTYTCLTISAPTYLLPLSLLPPDCPANEKIISPIHVETSSESPTTSHTCYSLQSKHDPTLTVMLTREQQAVAERHLLEVSVCLLAVCLMLCFAASLTNSLARRYHGNGLDLHSEPLIES